MDYSQIYAKPAEDEDRHLLLCQLYAERLEETPEPFFYKNSIALSEGFHGEHPESEGAKCDEVYVIWEVRFLFVCICIQLVVYFIYK